MKKIKQLWFVLKRRMRLLNMFLKKNGGSRAKYIRKHKLFGSMGENCWYEPYKLPSEPSLVFIGNNVNIATDVAILNHDIIGYLVEHLPNGEKCPVYKGKVVIGDNVFIGGRSIILGDVTIGNNVIIGAGTIVTKDIPDGVVAVGSPARVVGSFDDVIARYIQDNQNKEQTELSTEEGTVDENTARQ